MSTLWIYSKYHRTSVYCHRHVALRSATSIVDTITDYNGFYWLLSHCITQIVSVVDTVVYCQLISLLPVHPQDSQLMSTYSVIPYSFYFIVCRFCIQIMFTISVNPQTPSWSLYSQFIPNMFSSSLLWRGFTCSLLLFSFKDPPEISLVLSHSCTGMTLMMYYEKRHQNVNVI